MVPARIKFVEHIREFGVRSDLIAGEIGEGLEDDGEGGAHNIDRKDNVDYSLVGWHDCMRVGRGQLNPIF